MISDRVFESRVRELGTRRAASKLLYAGEGLLSLLPEHTAEDQANPHVAGRHELVFAVTASARVRTPKEEFALSRGELLLIEPGIDHLEMPTDPPSSYVLCWFSLDQSYAIITHTTYSAGSGQILGGPNLQLHGRTNVQNIAVAIGSELANRSWGWQVGARGLLQYLSCVLIRRIRRGQASHLGPPESPTVALDPSAWEVVQNALEHCRANFHRKLRVEDVAQAVGYSPSRLSHIFSAYVGQSVADHIRGLRMARARDLLETTDFTVAEVAHRVGYGDPAHFSRAFKRSERVAPKAYREGLRGQ